MSHRRVQIAFALAIGVCVTIITAAVVRALNSEFARDLVFWPNTVLQYLVPAPNIGAPDQPLYEGYAVKFSCIPGELSICDRRLWCRCLCASAPP